ncbi:hypothetical protein FQR65_LT14447 [Abscondita terminalis]|nr:hypothetical protein FQR65_LT14447 [Abscondita terminalis]
MGTLAFKSDSGWVNDNNTISVVYEDTSKPLEKQFYVNIPLKHIFSFAEDYNHVIINMRQELILIRSRSDLDCYTGNAPGTITLTKIAWKVLSDSAKIELFNNLNRNPSVDDYDNDYILPKKENSKLSSTQHPNNLISQNFEGSPMFRKKYGRWNKSVLPIETYETYETGGTDSDLNLNLENEEDRRNATASLLPILNSSSVNLFLEQYHELPRIYVDRMIHSGKNSADIDYTYGIHYDVASDKWIIGKSYVTIDDKDIVIDGVKYEGSPGLYELLIMSNPNYNIVTSKDRNNYRDIVIQTNLARHNYDPNQQLMRTQKEKEDKLKKKKSGYGVLYKEVNQKPVEYKYWKKVHELIDRLQLLWIEKLAGHGGCDNVILAIVEELYEDGYIEKPSFNFLNI